MRAVSLNPTGVVLLGAAVFLGCSSQSPNAPPGSSPSPISAAIDAGRDPSSVYNQMGLIATGRPLSYVGKVAYFASPSPDSTMVLASMSIANRSLSFVRDNETYRAPYEVRIRFLQGNAEIRNVNAMEIVRVADVQGSKPDGRKRHLPELFQAAAWQLYNFVHGAGRWQQPKCYAGRRDSRAPSQPGHLSTPLLVYEAERRSVLDSLPRLLASPRSSAVFGQDSSVSVYLEAYGHQTRLPVSFVVQNDKGG